MILAGTNDLARQIPLTAIENNYLMMADLASLYKIKVIFASVLPVSDYHKNVNPAYEMTKGRPPVFIAALNDWIQRLCQQRGVRLSELFRGDGGLVGPVAIGYERRRPASQREGVPGDGAAGAKGDRESFGKTGRSGAAVETCQTAFLV